MGLLWQWAFALHRHHHHHRRRRRRRRRRHPNHHHRNLPGTVASTRCFNDSSWIDLIDRNYFICHYR